MNVGCRLPRRKLGYVSIFAVGCTLCLPAQAMAQTDQTIYNTAMPTTIHVAIRSNNNPAAPILYVQTLGFQEYCEDVLPNEWMPAWNLQALRAGAIAIKMFAWYHTLHPTTEKGFTFDVDNTTNFQEFNYMSGTPITDLAVRSTWHLAYVPPNGEIHELDYRAGYPGSPDWAFVHSDMMSQWGSQYWASVDGMTYQSILELFYPDKTLRGI